MLKTSTSTLLLCFFSFTKVIYGQIDSIGGKNLYFDGSTSYVDTKDTSLYSKFTVECWVKSPNAPSSAQGKGPVHYEKNFQINWDHVSSGARNALVINATTGGWTGATFGPLEGNTWYHLAGTYDGDTLRTYTNGRLVTEKIINGGSPVREEYSLKIGKHAKLSGSQEFFNGAVDEVRIWNVARSGDEIRKNMYHPLAGIEAGLKHYYQFNEMQIQGDSTKNLATGNWAPIVNNPEKRASEFPFGKGNSQVFQVNANAPNFFSAPPAGLVTLQTDSANRSFPLLFTRINTSFYGTKPDSIQYKSQSFPYWIIQPLDTGLRFKSDYLRLDMSSLIPEFTVVVSEPNQLKVFNRPQNSVGDWTLVDTCSMIAFGSGHYIFSGFEAGQMAVGVPLSLVSVDKNVKQSSLKMRLRYENDSRTIRVERTEGLQDFSLMDMQGRKIQRWEVPNTGSDNLERFLTVSNPIPKGIYLLKGQGNGRLKVGKVWVE